MTPENRARMYAVLNGALRQAYLPGSSHSHHAHEQHAGGSASKAAPLTVAGTPATPTTGTGHDREALVTRFCEELEALAGVAYRVKDVHEAADRIAAIVARTETAERGRILSWGLQEIGLPGLNAALSVRGVTLASPDVPLEDPERAASLGVLASLGVGLTGAQAAIAESGSIVLASGPGRGRLASLLTPLHIAVLRRDTIVRTLEDFFAQRPDVPTLGSNCVFITGPSRTADIEMTLSRGVHGPREIHVIIV